MPTYLINKSDWADYVYLPPSITDTIYTNIIAPHVNKAQDIDLKNILHKDFWSEVYEVAASGADSANGKLAKVNYDLLLPYLKPIIVQFSYARWLDDSEVSISKYGAIQKTNEHSEPISEAKLSRLKIKERSAGSAYVRSMIDFMELTANAGKFATWDANRSNNGENRTGLITWST